MLIVKGLLVAFVVFLLFLLIHALIFHFRSPKRHFHVIVMTFYSLIPVYVGLYFLASYLFTPSANLADFTEIAAFINGFLIYLFLFFGYCQFYFIVDRSISVRINIELEKAGQALSFEEIKAVYSLDKLLERRLSHMVGQNYIVEDCGRYRNTRKGNFEAHIFASLKNFLNLGVGG